MKRLSDYKDEQAVELWADLLEPFSDLISNEEVQAELRNKDKSPMSLASKMLSANKDNVCKILERIDPTPVTGVNAFVRISNVLIEIMRDPDAADFFGFAGVQMQKEPSGSVTENTEEI